MPIGSGVSKARLQADDIAAAHRMLQHPRAPPDQIDVTRQVDLVNSNETKIAPNQCAQRQAPRVDELQLA